MAKEVCRVEWVNLTQMTITPLLRAGIPQKKWSSHHGQQQSKMQYLDAISKTTE